MQTLSFEELFGLNSKNLVPPAATATAMVEPEEQDEAPFIHSIDGLHALKPGFKQIVTGVLNDSLFGTICPIELRDGTVTLLCLEQYISSDQAEESERLLREAGKMFHKHARVPAAPTVLMGLVKQNRGDKSRVSVSSDRNPLTDTFIHMVTWGMRNKASDLHLNLHLNRATSEVRFTVDGKYVAPAEFQNIGTENLESMIRVQWQDIKGGNSPIFDTKTESEGRIEVIVDQKPVMLRWACMAADSGPSLTLRLLDLTGRQTDTSLSELGYLPSQYQAIERAVLSEGGAVVLAGVVGSGKSTTQAAMLRKIPSTRKIVTIEDPVEYLIPGAIQNTVSRSLEEGDVGAFNSKLMLAKRSAMTDLLIGEIRDRETGAAFMDLVLSGTNLYTTTHAPRVLTIPDRLASPSIGVHRDILMIPGTLKLLVYQALLPKLCSCARPFTSLFDRDSHSQEECEQAVEKWKRYGDLLTKLYGIDPAHLRVRNTDGCPACRLAGDPNTFGYQGRTVVAEMVEPGLDQQILRYMAPGKSIELMNYFESTRTAAYTDPDMTGKSAMECAVYKASVGMLDPRDIEPRFKAFSTVAIERQNKRRGDASRGN